jgi:methionine synthase II (cobalamin-independent)
LAAAAGYRASRRCSDGADSPNTRGRNSSSIETTPKSICGTLAYKFIALVGDEHLAVNVVDVATDRVETHEEVVATLEIAARYVPVHRLSATTNCGMAPMRRDVAYAKLGALGRGAHLLRARLGLAE